MKSGKAGDVRREGPTSMVIVEDVSIQQQQKDSSARSLFFTHISCTFDMKLGVI